MSKLEAEALVSMMLHRAKERRKWDAWWLAARKYMREETHAN